MRDFLVYLASPITGSTYDEAQDWRESVQRQFAREVHGISPLRAKEQRLIRSGGPILDSYEDCPLTSKKGITTRDRNDCMRADLVLVNLLGAKRVSIGTVMEIAWADSQRIPVVLIMEEGNIHEHSMLTECCGFRVATLEDAVDIVHAILLPDGRGTARDYPLQPPENFRSPLLAAGPVRLQ